MAGRVMMPRKLVDDEVDEVRENLPRLVDAFCTSGSPKENLVTLRWL